MKLTRILNCFVTAVFVFQAVRAAGKTNDRVTSGNGNKRTSKDKNAVHQQAEERWQLAIRAQEIKLRNLEEQAKVKSSRAEMNQALGELINLQDSIAKEKVSKQRVKDIIIKKCLESIAVEDLKKWLDKLQRMVNQNIKAELLETIKHMAEAHKKSVSRMTQELHGAATEPKAL